MKSKVYYEELKILQNFSSNFNITILDDYPLFRSVINPYFTFTFMMGADGRRVRRDGDGVGVTGV